MSFTGEAGPPGGKLSAADAAEAAAAIRRNKDPGLVPLCVTVLRSETWEPISDWLTVEGAESGLRLDLHFGDYGRLAAQVAAHGQLSRRGEGARHAILVVPELADLSTGAKHDPLGSDDWPAEAAQALAGIAGAVRARAGAEDVVLVQVPWLPVAGHDGLSDALQPGRTGERMARFRGECWRLVHEQVPGVSLIDGDAAITAVGRSRAFDARMWQAGRVPLSAEGLRAVAELWARALGAAVLPRRKCLVLDCDNTLWGGVLGEVGAEGIVLSTSGPGAGFHRLQQEALALARRGVLLALASKNDEGHVLAVLARHPDALLRPGVIAAHAIGWGSKADGLRGIAERLGIGLDSLVFVDDSAEECELVRQLCPQVAVHRVPGRPHQLPGFLLGLREFDVLATLREDHQRTQSYQVRGARTAAVKRAADGQGTGREEALGSLGIRVRVLDASRDPRVLERVAQLEAKTNQFNVLTPRLTQSALAATLSRGGAVLAVSVADRFGDFGITGASVMETGGGTATVRSLLLSCRVIGLGVEGALLAAIADAAASRGATTMEGRVAETERNAPARDVFAVCGFAKVEAREGQSQWRRPVAGMEVLWPAWITREQA